MKKLKLVLLIGLMAVSMGLYGCGDDGSNGLAGADGAAGDTGPAGPVTATNEACTVCHSTGKIADIEYTHAVEVRTAEATINDVAVDTTGGVTDGNVVVLFSVTAGTFDPTTAAFTLAQLVPGTGGDASHFESYTARARTKDATVAPIIQGYYEKAITVGGASPVDLEVGTLDDLGSGNWSYTFGLINANVDGDITSDMNDAVNVSSVGGAFDASTVDTYPNAVTYDASLLHRVGMEFKDTDGVRNVTNAFYDFVPDGVSTPETRDIVTIDACNQCHGGDRLHKGYTVEYCVTCHNTSTFNPATPFVDSTGTEVSGNNKTVALKVLVHKWHMGENLTDKDYRINAHNPTETTFPQPANNCTVCHNDTDAPSPLAQVDNWKTVPTINACGACHDDVDFAAGTNHGGGAQANNKFCTACHDSAGTAGSFTDIVTVHSRPAAVVDTPEFDVAIAMTAPANGTHYVAGEAPEVTVTLTATDGGVVANYMAAKGTAGSRDGILAGANLYVYGPRAKALPVLTTGSTTDTTAGTATQGHALFTGGTDALVTTDGTGFKYQLMAIPADMAPGTYMVRFEGGDYGPVSATDYVTNSTNLINIQIGTATPEAKVASDNCINCHGATRMHLTGSHAHNAPFNTDYCLACHDQSGGYGTPIMQRVHAVHSASDAGADGHDRVWTNVTFPRSAKDCDACHDDSKNASHMELTGARSLACLGCHGDNAGVSDHVLQNGGHTSL